MTNIRWLARSAARAQCGREAARRRHGFGKNGRRPWMPSEQAIVANLFPNKEAVCRALPHRTWCAIRNQATKLGLRKPVYRWMSSDVSRLRRMWRYASREELQNAFPHLTFQQIKDQAKYLKLKRARPPAQPSGIAVIDQIKKRARDLNLSMHDIDEMASSKNYFRNAAWLNGHIHRRAIYKAIEALDGEVVANWRDAA